MSVVNVHEAETQLSRLLAQVEAGEEVVIARRGQPVARLVRCNPAGNRRFGAMKGKIKITDAFFEPLPEEELKGRIPDFPVTRSHPPASWPSAANSSICRTYRKTAGEESRRRSPVANRWMRP